MYFALRNIETSIIQRDAYIYELKNTFLNG